MAARCSGILRNELYVGRVVWNRWEWVKRPGTGTRTYRLRPRDQWLTEEHPELRIVPQSLWDRVQSRLSNTHPGGNKKGRRPTYLLTGILKCADCGRSLTMIDQRCYGCGTRNRGGDSACDNPIRIRRAKLEARFFAVVQEQLLAPDTIRWAEREVAKLLAVPPVVEIPALKAELHAVTADLERVVDAICKVGISTALEAKLKALEESQRVLKAQIVSAETIVGLPDRATIGATWRSLVEGLGPASEGAQCR